MLIAHATDSLDASDISFVHAVGIAARSDSSEIVTCRVTRGVPESHEPPNPARLLERWNTPNARVSHRLLECPLHDFIADELIAACESVRPELLIMATEARTGGVHVREHSIAEAVARNVAVPSLLLPHGAAGLIDPQSGALQLRRVLILGGSQSDTDLGIDAAAWFLRAAAVSSSVELSVLHAGKGSVAPVLSDTQGLSLKLSLQKGSVERAVAGFVPQYQPDLIVSVSHGHDELLDILFASHTERVLRLAKRPLLRIPPSFVCKS
jgi:hypothetical protein